MNFGDIAANTSEPTSGWPSTSDFVIGQLTGITSGASANSGKVGELITVAVDSSVPVSISSGVATNITNISLTAGDWDVEGQVVLKYSSATQSADGQAGINSISATLPASSWTGYDCTRLTTTTSNASIVLPRRIMLSSGSLTVYLVGKATFSAGSCDGFGYITARRVR